MLKLGVNIDHTATLREARYRGMPEGEPDPIEAALACVRGGCHGITAHLREDRRHMLDRDIDRLSTVLEVPLNFEMANTPEMLAKAMVLQPASVCLVPEKRQEITTEGGLDVLEYQSSIADTVHQLQSLGIEVSLFIDPDLEIVRAAVDTGARAIELHTGAYAEKYEDPTQRQQEIIRLAQASDLGHLSGLKINAGHGLHYANLLDLLKVPWLEELNIGHSIVSRALFVGMEQAVDEMLQLMRQSGDC